MKKEKWVFLILVVLMVCQAIYFYPMLPAMLASHFNLAGDPNDFMPKPLYFLVNFLVLGMLSLGFLLLPASILKAPKERIRLPHKEYWLAPERIHEADAHIRSFMVRIGNAVLLLFVFVNQMVFQFNASGARQLPGRMMLGAIIAFVVFAVVWSGMFLRKFYQIPTNKRESGNGEAK